MSKVFSKDEVMELITTHDLPFEVAPWINDEFHRFRIGTCTGLWRHTPESYDILAIDNESPGNGHFEDVLEWFEHSSKRDKKVFRFLQVWNVSFKKHLGEKRGFVCIDEHEDTMEKRI